MKAFKVILIITVFIGIGWFGSRFGPPSNDAEAMIYEKLSSFTRAMPEYLFDEKETSEPRTIMVNGFTTHLTVGKSDDDVSKILDFYEKQYKDQPLFNITQDVMDSIKDEKMKESAKKHNEIMKNLVQFQHLRFEKEDYGFWATFEFSDPGLKVGSEKYIEKMGKALESGRLGEIGTARIVIALRNKKTFKTKVINIWSDRDFNINNLQPDAFGDMPGKDIQDIPRLPGSKRVQTVEQENSATIDSLVIYEGGGTAITSMAFYRSRMPGLGWKSSQVFEQAMGDNKIKNSLFFTKKGKECTIIVDEDEDSGNIMTTVILREGKSRKD